MTVYQPVCTCHVEGIGGCAKHNYGDVSLEVPQSVETTARLIAEGGAFRDEDAVRVARAFLEATT